MTEREILGVFLGASGPTNDRLSRQPVAPPVHGENCGAHLFAISARRRGAATADVRVLDTSIPVSSVLFSVEGATVTYGGRDIVYHRLLGRPPPADAMELIDRELVGSDVRRRIHAHCFVIQGLDLVRTLGITSR